MVVCGMKTRLSLSVLGLRAQGAGGSIPHETYIMFLNFVAWTAKTHLPETVKFVNGFPRNPVFSQHYNTLPFRKKKYLLSKKSVYFSREPFSAERRHKTVIL